MINRVQTGWEPANKRRTILMKPIFNDTNWINKSTIVYELQVAIWKVDNFQ